MKLELSNKIKTIIILKYFIIIFIIQLLLISNNTDIGKLVYYNIDEYAFYGSISRIYNGIIDTNLRLIFGTGFFNYGWLYFLISFILALPGFIIDNESLILIGPRLFSALSSMFSLYFLLKILNFFNVDFYKSFLTLLFISLLPGFWSSAIIFHPDWPYLMLIIISFYYLIKDNFLFGNKYLKAVFFFSLAVSIKIQAIIFVFLLFLYVIIKKKPFLFILKNFILILSSIIFIRLLTNPYLFNSEGLTEFYKDFQTGSSSDLNLNDYLNLYKTKLSVISKYYIDILILIILGYYNFVFLKQKSANKFNIILFLNLIISFLYTFFIVVHPFEHYYLPIIILFILNTTIASKGYKTYLPILLIICLTQLFNKFNTLHNIFFYKTPQSLILKTNKVTDWCIYNDCNKSNILVYGHITFDFKKAKINYSNIHRGYGDFDKSLLYEYNNHNPGIPITKDFFLLSKDSIDSKLVQQIIAIAEKEGYKKIQEDEFNVFFKYLGNSF